jgi:hypothetical protein
MIVRGGDWPGSRVVEFESMTRVLESLEYDFEKVAFRQSRILMVTREKEDKYPTWIYLPLTSTSVSVVVIAPSRSLIPSKDAPSSMEKQS